MREEASSFEKIDYVYVILSYCLNIWFLSQYFFLGNCFAKSAFNSTNLFQGLPQGLQLNGSYLGSSLGFSVIGSSLGFLGPRYASMILKVYILNIHIFSWVIFIFSVCPLFWKTFIICLNDSRANYLHYSSKKLCLRPICCIAREIEL